MILCDLQNNGACACLMCLCDDNDTVAAKVKNNRLFTQEDVQYVYCSFFIFKYVFMVIYVPFVTYVTNTIGHLINV